MGTYTIHKKIGLFVNLLAGNGKASTLALQIVKILKSKNIDYEMYNSAWPETFNKISEAWIIGGDGTLNYFLNKFTDITLPLAIYKGGTGNDFAWKLYGNMNVEQQIEHVLSQEARAVDAAECNGKIFINALGAGFDGEVLKSMKAFRFPGGHLKYLGAVLQKIFSYREKNYHIVSNHQLITERFLLVMINNSSRTGGGFMVSPEADITDGKLNIVLCKPLTILKRLQNLPLIKKGKHLHKKFILHKEVESVEILCEEETSAHLDGELITSRSFNISVMPKRYLFKY